MGKNTHHFCLDFVTLQGKDRERSERSRPAPPAAEALIQYWKGCKTTWHNIRDEILDDIMDSNWPPMSNYIQKKYISYIHLNDIHISETHKVNCCHLKKVLLTRCTFPIPPMFTVNHLGLLFVLGFWFGPEVKLIWPGNRSVFGKNECYCISNSFQRKEWWANFLCV